MTVIISKCMCFQDCSMRFVNVVVCVTFISISNAESCILYNPKQPIEGIDDLLWVKWMVFVSSKVYPITHSYLLHRRNSNILYYRLKKKEWLHLRILRTYSTCILWPACSLAYYSACVAARVFSSAAICEDTKEHATHSYSRNPSR